MKGDELIPLARAPWLATDRGVQPILVSHGNAQLMTGLTIRWLRRFAAQHGVPVLRLGRFHAIEAEPLLAALRRVGSSQEAAAAVVADEQQPELTAEQEQAIVIRRLGLVRVNRGRP